jgi:hypothetical protein
LAVELKILSVSAVQINRCLALDTKVTRSGSSSKEVEIQHLNVNDWITSNLGPVKVVAISAMIWQQVYRIKTRTKREIVCSIDHIFPTTSGNKSIFTGLKLGDILFSSKPPSKGLVDAIETIEYVGERDTIDIEVAGNHLFYANDILTHNSGIQEQNFDASHIAGGISKFNTVDNVMAIFTSPSLRERGEYEIQFLKTRSSSGVGSKISLNYNTENMRITNLNGVASEQRPTSAAKSIQTQIMGRKPISKTNTKADSPVMADERAKIRNLASSLNNR